MRKFAFSDGTTQKALNGENLIWLINPTGLGAQRGADLANIGSGFFEKYGDDFPMQKINGDLYVLKPAYSTYKAFVDWLLNVEDLYLIYAPESTEYKRKVTINSLQKTELEGGDWLMCPIVLDCLTPWYTEEILTFTDSDSGQTAAITAGGQIGATVTIASTAPVSDPKIVMQAAGETFAVAETANINSPVFYSNDYNNSFLTADLEDQHGDASILPFADLTKPVFGRLKHGNAFAVNVTPSGSYSINVKKWWWTV